MVVSCPRNIYDTQVGSIGNLWPINLGIAIVWHQQSQINEDHEHLDSKLPDTIRNDDIARPQPPARPTCSLMTDFRWAPQNREIILKITNKWIYEQEARK
jgi:hypothetical protein